MSFIIFSAQTIIIKVVFAIFPRFTVFLVTCWFLALVTSYTFSVLAAVFNCSGVIVSVIM